jgi:AsmA protein
MPRRRHRPFPIYRVLRVALATLSVAALVGALAFCAALLLIDPNAYKREIEAAVKQATGRDLDLRGPMTLAFGLPPRLIAEDVTLSNPGGLSRQEMVTLNRAEARIAVWPLLVGEIDLTDLTLIHPDVLLERDVNGRGNWVFATAAPQDAPAGPAGQASGEAPPPVSPLALGRALRSRVAVQSIHVEEGRIGWRPRPGAETVQLTIPRLDGSAGGPGGTLLLTGTLASAGRALTLNGEVGSLDRLFDRGATVPWPVQVTLRDPGAQLAATGSIAQPMRGEGMSLQFDLAVTDFAGLAPFLPAGVPAPHAVNGFIRWGDGTVGDAVGLAGFTLHLDGLKLPGLLPGLEITHADLTAPGLDRPLHADIEGNSAAVGTLRLVVNAATLAAVLPGAHPADKVAIDATLDAGRALISAKGVAAEPSALKGVDLAVFARLPDVAAFGPLVDHALPPLSQVAFEGQVIGDLTPDGAIGIRKGTLTLPEAQVSGDADIRFGARPSVHAVIASQRVDLDSLFADLAAAKAKPDQPPPLAAAAPPPEPQTPAAPPARVAASRWLIPDEPIDFSPLDRMDVELRLQVDQLQAGGVGYSQIRADTILRNGKLTIDPLTGVMPGGAAELRLSIDTRAPDVPMSLAVQAPSLQLGQVAALLGSRFSATGSVVVDADLQGAGRTPHAIAGSLDGKLGIGSVNSEIDNRLLLALMRLARLPEVPLSAAGTTRLRCVALRLDMNKGVATVGAMVADAGRVAVTGGGTLDLGQEQLALQLRPLLRLNAGGAGGVVVPVRVSGGFLDPKVASDTGGKGGPPITGSGLADPCPPALAMVAAPAAARAKQAATVAKPEPGGTAASRLDDVIKELTK